MSALGERLRRLFGAEPETAGATNHDAADKHLTAAALLVETAVMDGGFDEAERCTVATLLHERFGLDETAAADLIADAEERTAASHSVFSFTNSAKNHFSHNDRVELIEMLWEVAYADGVLHDYEENLLRRVAGLIYVTDRERGEARKRVLARLGL